VCPFPPAAAGYGYQKMSWLMHRTGTCVYHKLIDLKAFILLSLLFNNLGIVASLDYLAG
jgi:hypothetical protein